MKPPKCEYVSGRRGGKCDACKDCEFAKRHETEEQAKTCINRNEKVAVAVGFRYVKCINQLRNKIVWGYHPDVFDNIDDPTNLDMDSILEN